MTQDARREAMALMAAAVENDLQSKEKEKDEGGADGGPMHADDRHGSGWLVFLVLLVLV